MFKNGCVRELGELIEYKSIIYNRGLSEVIEKVFLNYDFHEIKIAHQLGNKLFQGARKSKFDQKKIKQMQR